MKKLTDDNILQNKLLLDWYDGILALDLASRLHSIPAEMQFRELFMKSRGFIDYLRADSESDDSESSSSDNEASDSEKESSSDEDDKKESSSDDSDSQPDDDDEDDD